MDLQARSWLARAPAPDGENGRTNERDPAAGRCPLESRRMLPCRAALRYPAKQGMEKLPLGSAAGELLDLLLLRTADVVALRLGGGLLARCAFDLLAFFLVGDVLRIC